MPNGSNGYLYDFFIKLGFSRFAAQTAEFLILRPAKILLIVLLAVIGGRLAARVTRRFISTLGARTPIQIRSDRAPKRATAIGSTAAGVAKVIVWAIAIPLLLGEIGVNLGPFVAGATIIGAALGFGAQTLVRDLLAGFMILTEDQYAVGDTIFHGDTNGIVEDVNLLRTRIRDDDGKVWFVANGEIRKVANSSLGWSRAVVDLQLPYEADLDAAIDAAASEAGAMAQEPEWQDVILSPPEAYTTIVKVEGNTVRVTANTRATMSFPVGKALLARVARRIRKGGGPSDGGSDGSVGGEPESPPAAADPPPE
jgi:small conductance mechanosensitive channel